MDEYELNCTKKYEGAYTPEEIELNIRLYEECSKECIDKDAIEYLLVQGADPLGGRAVSGWGLLDHVYDEIVGESQDNDSINLPLITELFLKHGMDVNNPRVPYDDDNSLHPLWSFTFVPNKNAIVALKLLLDAGLDADGAGEFWGHSTFDWINITCTDPNEPSWYPSYVWTMKMIMLIASYRHILDEDEDLRRFINYDRNVYDVNLFSNWDDYHYEFDTSRCSGSPQFYKSVINIYLKETTELVWKIGVSLNPGEY